MKLFIKSLAVASTLTLIACGGGGAQSGLTDGGSIDAGTVDSAKDEALAAEKDNHEKRKEIFELKGKLGIFTDDETE